ncbi:MAG: hypothetical protein LKH04_11915, partial [Lachnospiraceae bacterium]|nr:hypothetical protein [Lachnospiraceae bacterium]MCI1453655.1 hypothetical protein [Lachnospiraceae bacterium]
ARWPKGRAPLMIILIRAGGLLQSPGMEVVTLQHEALYPVNSNVKSSEQKKNGLNSFGNHVSVSG